VGPEQLRPPVLKPDLKCWVVHTPVARIYRADLPLKFRHAVGPFHSHPHTDLARLLQHHNFLLPRIARDRYSKLSGAATLSSQEWLAHDPYAPFLRFAKNNLHPELGVGCLYSPSCPEGKFSETLIQLCESLCIKTGAKGRCVP
jgi:hypothetical protein